MLSIVMDGVTYNLRVRFDTINRSFRLDEGENAGIMLSGLYNRDLYGTYYDYTMEIERDPNDTATYDAFYEAISAPVESHSVTLPYGQGTITFDAMVTSGSDVYKGKIAGKQQWSGLVVQFTAKKPYREPA